MEKPKPDPKMVLEAVKDLPTSGILAQDGYSGMLFLDLVDEWIFKALPVIKDYGYISPPFFVFPPVPLGAHIRIITENEAIDYELVTERVGKKEIPGLGKTVNFKVVEAFSHHPELRTYGIESRYWIRVESEELDKIRMDLTGLPRPDLGFCINVGVRLEDMLHETEEKPDENQMKNSGTRKKTEITTKKGNSSSTINEDEAGVRMEDMPDETEEKPVETQMKKSGARKGTEIATEKRDIKLKVSSSGINGEKQVETPKKKSITRKRNKNSTKKRERKIKPKVSITRKRTPAPGLMIKSNVLIWAIIIINTATLSMLSTYGYYNYFSN